jgi:hypothetical protein
VPIVPGGVPVDADRDPDAPAGADLGDAVVEQKPVRLQAEPQPFAQQSSRDGREAVEALRAGQQGLAAVQDQADRGDGMRLDVLGDLGARGAEDLVGHEDGLIAPALIGRLVHVAVAAREVAAAVDLHDELVEGLRRPALRRQRGHVEGRGPRDRPEGPADQRFRQTGLPGTIR